MKVRAQEAGRRLMKSTAEDDKGVLISGKFICRPVSMIGEYKTNVESKVVSTCSGSVDESAAARA